MSPPRRHVGERSTFSGDHRGLFSSTLMTDTYTFCKVKRACIYATLTRATASSLSREYPHPQTEGKDRLNHVPPPSNGFRLPSPADKEAGVAVQMAGHRLTVQQPFIGDVTSGGRSAEQLQLGPLERLHLARDDLDRDIFHRLCRSSEVVIHSSGTSFG